jgi:glucarate dehydratase
MLHLGAVLPNLSFDIDAHYHHLRDDLVVGGKFQIKDGKIKVPDEPGLGVKLDRDKLAQYAELYKELGGYPYDRDSRRPGWYPLLPNERWADPTKTE